MMKEYKLFHSGESCQFDGGSVVGVTPVTLFVIYLLAGILSIIDDYIGIFEEIDKGRIVAAVFRKVLGVC